MTPKNKILAGLITLLAICLIAIYGLFKLYQHEKEERKRYNNNMIALIADKNRQQSLTIDELKTLYPKYDSIAKLLQIKTKNITDIIETQYRFKDSLFIFVQHI